MYLHVSLTYEHARLLAAVEPGGVDDEQTARDAAQELDGASHLVGDDVRAVVDRLDQLAAQCLDDLTTTNSRVTHR